MASKKIIPIILFGLVLFFGTYKLSESPPTWYDEGLIVQAAINRAQTGTLAVQIAPGRLISPQFISTGYPVFYPIAAVFKYLGVSLRHARWVMLIYLLLTAGVFFFLAKTFFGFRYASYATLLLVGFAPFYGNGKNVLGEVPGLFFLLLFLFCLNRIERDYGKKTYYMAGGISAGLCVAAKPLFLVLLPAGLLAVLWRRKRIDWHWSAILLAIISFSALFYLWLVTQFGQRDSLANVLGYYTNPYGLQNIWPVVWHNIGRFFTELSPAYFFILFILWVSGLVIRLKNQERVSLAETTALIFSVFILLAYLRTAGWYRYFFVANVITLLFAPVSIFTWWTYAQERFFPVVKTSVVKFFPAILLSLLIFFQFYQLGFKSWVADYYSSHRTKDLVDYFKNFPADKSVFLYDSPELVIFLPHNNYYQYLEITASMRIGQQQLAAIKTGILDMIVIKSQALAKADKLFTYYKVQDSIDEYTLLERVGK